jgi:pyrroloquinoline quinone biosynthesis protein D
VTGAITCARIVGDDLTCAHWKRFRFRRSSRTAIGPVSRRTSGTLTVSPPTPAEIEASSPDLSASESLWKAVPRPHPEAGFQRVDDRLLAAGPDDFLHVFEEEDGRCSEVAERIVELADGTRSVVEIADALRKEFEVDADRCRADTAAFIQLLIRRHLLVWQ